jgi:uncharacterized protein YigA (DUF484 family)
MSLHPEDRTDADSDESRIADYLIAHPDFLERHPEVLAALQIPHETGSAVSLIERQVKQLRADSAKYRRQLEDLIEVARENDRLTAKLHQLILALIDAATLDEVLTILQDQLLDQFRADAVELKLFAADELERSAEAGDSGAALFSDFMAKGRPSCGNLPAAQLQYLFGDQVGDTGSVALVPLNAGEQEGVLAIGSHDPQRFHASKSVDFLTRLGEIVSHTLQAVTSPGA